MNDIIMKQVGARPINLLKIKQTKSCHARRQKSR